MIKLVIALLLLIITVHAWRSFFNTKNPLSLFIAILLSILFLPTLLSYFVGMALFVTVIIAVVCIVVWLIGALVGGSEENYR